MNTHAVGAPVLSARPGSTLTSTDEVYRKVSWRIMPLLLICYLIAYLDRINIGYAQLQMKQTLTFSDAVYGLGAGIFFVGYFLFEVPSNLLLERIGARKTLLRIMFCWGIVASGMMFVSTPTEFYIARFLLGVFEAGFFPGILLYLTYWYPSARRAAIIALFMSATTLAAVVAGPLSGGIMKHMNGLHGIAGWQWLFIVQGLPASILGIVAYFYLQDKPEDANWLNASEKNIIRRELDLDGGVVAGASHASALDLLRDPKVYLLSLVYFLLMGATYTMVFWLPTLVKSWGVADLVEIGIYTAIPNAVGVVGMVLVGRSSDRFSERRWHFMGCACLAALCLGITTLLKGQLAWSVFALSIAVIGIASATPLFFTTTTEYLSKSSAAAGIALINSLGNVGGFAGPYLMGWVKANTGSFSEGFAYLAGLMVLGCVPLFILRKGPDKG